MINLKAEDREGVDAIKACIAAVTRMQANMGAEETAKILEKLAANLREGTGYEHVEAR